MRAFVAIEIPATVRAQLAGLAGRLRSAGGSVAWVRPENIHLTLRFLGDLAPEPLERISSELAAAYRGIAPFMLAARGTGAFPNPRRPSVLWVGVEPADGPLAAIQQHAEAAARVIGLPAETKAFHPHLTLARVKDWRSAVGMVARFAEERDFVAGDFAVGSVSLFTSTLTPRGAVYTRLREFGF